MLSCALYAQRIVQLQSLSDRSLLILHRILQLLTSEVLVSLHFTHIPDVFRIPRFPRIVSFFIRSVLQVFRIVILRTLLYFFSQRCIHSSSMDPPSTPTFVQLLFASSSSSITVVKSTSIFFSGRRNVARPSAQPIGYTSTRLTPRCYNPAGRPAPLR